MNPFETFLETYFDEVDPKSFYRAVFPAGELEMQGEKKQGSTPLSPSASAQKRHGTSVAIVSSQMEATLKSTF